MSWAPSLCPQTPGRPSWDCPGGQCGSLPEGLTFKENGKTLHRTAKLRLWGHVLVLNLSAASCLLGAQSSCQIWGLDP